MNVLLWVLQVALALLYIAGWGFKTFNPDDVAKQITALPRGGWRALGAFDMLGALLLLVPPPRRGCPDSPRSPPARSLSRRWPSRLCTRGTRLSWPRATRRSMPSRWV
jgi:hypothetical protein